MAGRVEWMGSQLDVWGAHDSMDDTVRSSQTGLTCPCANPKLRAGASSTPASLIVVISSKASPPEAVARAH